MHILTGEVAYAGKVQFAGGYWLGLSLDEPVGKNNGTVNGVEYFQCQKYHGLFLRPDACILPQNFSTTDDGSADEWMSDDELTRKASPDLKMMSPDALRSMVAKLG